MSAITGHSVPIKLGDKVYNVAPLTDKDIAELDAYVKHVHIQTAIDTAAQVPEQVGDKLIAAAVQQASSISFMSPAGAAIIRSTDGVARILWHGLKHNHPGITWEEVRGLIFNRRAIDEANRVFNKLNVEPLNEVAAKGKALGAALSRKKRSILRSSKGTTSRRKR
jgi:hypothetical protein